MNFTRFSMPLMALVSSACAAPLLDIKAIAGKSQKEVQALLGSPGATEKTKYGPKLTYKNETIEVLFIKDKADWITFTPKAAVPYSKESLSALGLPATKPTFSNANVIRWEPCEKFLSVSMFPGETAAKLDYVYIKVATP